MVCKETQSCPTHGWLYPEEVVDGQCAKCGTPALAGRTEKMSKSKKNVVDPDKLIDQYGADTARLFSLFAAPPEKHLEWNDQSVDGCYRFLNRVWRLVYDHRHLVATGGFEGDLPARNLRRLTHRTIRKVTEDIDGRFHFNTAIAAIMELVNGISAFEGKTTHPAVTREAIESVVRLLAPFVPHVTEELWSHLGHGESLEAAGWPVWDAEAIIDDEKVIVVQVNGKMRGKITVAADLGDAEVKAEALAEANVARALAGQTIRNVIVVPNRLVNIVVG
jgi:leucyl-tRNA synthetase